MDRLPKGKHSGYQQPDLEVSDNGVAYLVCDYYIKKESTVEYIHVTVKVEVTPDNITFS